jgi:glycine cleavage system H protein
MDQTGVVRSCILPLNLYYKVEEHLWLRIEADKSVTLGFTDVAQTTAGRMLIVSFRPVGARYKPGKTIAIVESAKWLGPLRAPMEGVLAAANESLLDDAGLVNRSPYHKGWIVRFQPDDLEAGMKDFVTDLAATQAYESFMERRNLEDCIHCEGYEFPEGWP